ncbi:MAG: hypothetical protein BEN19_04755 [Epulopiscium sp. Nuni2H_MBin003]|nr:MAG: hypothetical protein BEN19_04755 [Epulopiscium sp. Nuni2H_MBin003]
MINQLVSEQAALFIECIKVGILMGAIYDLIRISRRIIKHFDIIVHIEDILYWVACSFISFGILYMHNYANIRLFALLGIILGAALYFLTFSVIFMKIATAVINFTRKCVGILVIKPIKWIWKQLMIPVRYINKLMYKTNQKNKAHLRVVNRKATLKNADIKTDLNVIRNKIKKY